MQEIQLEGEATEAQALADGDKARVQTWLARHIRLDLFEVLWLSLAFERE